VKRNNLKLNEIPQRIQVFEDVSHSLDSSNVIEDIILETVHSKLGINFEFKKDYKFSDYIKELRKKRRSD
jgi:hypothetical protein